MEGPLTTPAALARGAFTQQSYTSQASLLDLDPLPVLNKNDETERTFSGKRVRRGLYRASDGRYINADINAAGNIVRKVAPDAFSEARAVEDGKGVLASLRLCRHLAEPMCATST